MEFRAAAVGAANEEHDMQIFDRFNICTRHLNFYNRAKPFYNSTINKSNAGYKNKL